MFKRGDIVRLQSGNAPIKILRVDYPWAFGRYLYSGINIERRMCEMRTYQPKREDLYHMTNPFSVGEQVKLKNGAKPQIISKVNGKYVWATYIGSNAGPNSRRLWTDYEYFAKPVITQGELFDTREGPATLVGMTRRGLYVLEKINEDEEIIYQRHKPVKYKHYTVELENLVDKYRFHRQAHEGQVKVGDLIKRPNGKLYTVKRVNTRNHNEEWLEGEIMTGRKL